MADMTLRLNTVDAEIKIKRLNVVVEELSIRMKILKKAADDATESIKACLECMKDIKDVKVSVEED